MERLMPLSQNLSAQRQLRSKCYRRRKMKTRLHTCASTCDGRMEAIVEAGLAVEDEADSDRTRAA